MSAEPDWQRPHPLSVVVLVASFIAGNAWPIGVVVIAGGGGIGFESIAVLVGGATVGWGALGWYMTRYAVTDDAVEYRSGVINRQARAIPLDRIQQVSVGEPVLARVVGLAVVQVAEASADGDVEIRYLGLSAANELTARLRQLSRARDAAVGPDVADGVSSLPAPPAPPATRIHQTVLRELLTYQLSAAAPAVALMALVIVVSAAAVGLNAGVAPGAVTLAVGAGILASLLLLVVIGTTLQFGNFTLERGARSLTMDTGMLSRRQVEVRPDRIQTLTVTSGPVARRFDLHEVKFSAATGKAAKQQQQMAHMAPAARTADVPALIQGSVDVDAGFGVDIEAVSPLTIRRALVRAGILYLVGGLPASVVLFIAHPAAAVVATLLWWVAAVWYARARHARLGLSLDENRLVVRRGVLQHHLTQLPLTNVQSVTTSASFFQRRLGLASLRVATAGIGPNHYVHIPDLPAERAEALRLHLGVVAAESRWELRG